MSINPLNDISRVYLEEVASQNLNETSHKKPKRWWDDDGDGRGYEPGEVSGKFKRKKVKEALDPVGREDKDIDNDGDHDKSDKYLLNRRKVRGAAIAKKKVAKEGYSNWREELSEIVEVVNKDTNDQKIEEKKVNNKIKINPTIGEAIETLGGTLLEMVEIDEVDYIVESVYDELLEEGYEEHDIEEAIEYALTEATVTYGHDTPTGEKKKPKNLLKAVGRLARQKLSSKVRDAKSAARRAVSSGARKVASAATKIADRADSAEKHARRNTAKGHEEIMRNNREYQTAGKSSGGYRNKGAGTVEKASSGSYKFDPSHHQTKTNTSSSKKKANTIKDPWDDEPTSSQQKPKPKPKAAQKTTTVPKKPLSKKQRQAVVRAQRRNPNLSSSDAERIASSVGNEKQRGQELRARMAAAAAKHGISEDYYDLETRSVKPGKPGRKQKETIEKLATTATTKKKTRNPVGTSRRGGGSFKPSSPEEAKSNIKSWGDYWSSAAKGYKEEYVSEKTLTTAETKKKEELVKKMKKNLDNFETRYPGRGEEVMYATATKMAQKMAEQYIDEAKLPRSQKKSTKEKKTSVPNRPKHVVQLDLDQAGVREVKTKKLKDPETGKKKTTKVEPAKINVKGETGKVVRTVSTGDFHKEKLGKGETMDFSPLRDPEKFRKTTKANKHAINKSRGAVIEPNTARGAFRRPVGEEVSLSEDNGKVDNKSIVKHLKNIGYNKRGMKVKPGHFTGDMPGSGSPGKKLIATKHDIKKYQPQKVSHIDDDPKNLEPLEAHRKSTQGSRGKKRGSDPKIHTQHVGSYRKSGGSRLEPREHGRVRRFSGVRDAGNVPEPQTTKQIQRARKKARKGMQREAIDPSQMQQTQTAQQPSQKSQQNAKEKSAAQKAKSAAIALKTRELQTLRQTPAGTNVPSFGG